MVRGELNEARSTNYTLEDQRVKNEVISRQIYVTSETLIVDHAALEARVSDLVKQLFAAHVESRDLQDLLNAAQDACSVSQVRDIVNVPEHSLRRVGRLPCPEWSHRLCFYARRMGY